MRWDGASRGPKGWVWSGWARKFFPSCEMGWGWPGWDKEIFSIMWSGAEME